MTLKALAIASVLILTSGAALAEHDRNGHNDRHPQASCGKGHFNKANWQEHRAEHFAKHQEKLHTMLQLSASQENAWKTFQAQIKPEDKTARPEHDKLETLNTVQRLDRMEAWDKARDSRAAERSKAIRTFYAQLNDAQKKVFDENAFPHPQKPHH